MVFPWIQFLGKKKRLSDIEYLAIKEFDGKLVQNDAQARTTTGDLCTLTASSGKDMYIAKAKIQTNTTGANGTVTVQLKINAVVFEEFKVSDLPVTSDTSEFEFVTLGFKVAATQIIKLEVTGISSLSINGQLICFEEDTGASPAV